VCAIFVLRDGELVEMVEQPYRVESVLQGHLAVRPELLSAEAAGDERRQWLLVKREMVSPTPMRDGTAGASTTCSSTRTRFRPSWK
jgi:hypothetical protein